MFHASDMELTFPDKNGNPLQWRIPAELHPFIEAIGIDASARLFLAHGGAPAFFSKHPREDSSLSKTIGREAVIKLTEICHGHYHRIPLATEFLVRYLRSQGVSVSQIARQLRISDVTVRSKLVDYETVKRQKHRTMLELKKTVDFYFEHMGMDA